MPAHSPLSCPQPCPPGLWNPTGGARQNCHLIVQQMERVSPTALHASRSDMLNDNRGSAFRSGCRHELRRIGNLFRPVG